MGDEVVADPCEALFREPTLSQELADLEFTNVEKRNYKEVFDRPEFTGVYYKPVLNRFKKQVYNKDTKKPEFDSHPRKKGRPKDAFLHDNNLDWTSRPHEWFAAFLPHSLVAKWTTFTNMKAGFQHAGKRGGPYKNEWTDFDPFELKKHIGVYILQGLSPSPQVNQKFRTQAQDSVNVCNFISCCLGPGAERRHKLFRRFFAVQDDSLPTPPRMENPNHKIDPFLKWIKEVSMKAWNLARNFSVDEQTMRMQGRHPMKVSPTKKKVTGFNVTPCVTRVTHLPFSYVTSCPPRNIQTKA